MVVEWRGEAEVCLICFPLAARQQESDPTGMLNNPELISSKSLCTKKEIGKVTAPIIAIAIIGELIHPRAKRQGAVV